jgi:hypothetical protein
MPIVSIVRRLGRKRLVRPWLLLATLCAMVAGCVTPPSVVVEDLLEPLGRPALWIPTDGDLAAARLARAALTAHSIPATRPGGPPRVAVSVESALSDLTSINLPKDDAKLVPLAIDLRNSTLDDPIAYRAESRKLNSQRNLDPRIVGRLDRTIGDDPIKLAKRRQFDGWHRLWARTFNAVSQPLGSTAITGFVLAPYQLANSLIHWVADFSNNEPLSLTDRQALVLRQDFLRKHPTTELTEILESKIARSTILLEKTLALRRVRAAEAALDSNEPALALHQAEVARSTLVLHPSQNRRLRKRIIRAETKAFNQVEELSRRRIRSLESVPGPEASQFAARALAYTLLTKPSSSPELSRRLADYRLQSDDSGDGLSEYIFALRRHEGGYDRVVRTRLTELAASRPDRNKMARHAQALLDDSWQNPFGAFERLDRRASRDELAWRLAGEWVRRTRYPNLPTPIAYLVDTPTILITIILAPLRAMIAPWTGSPDFRRAPALAAYRYLRKFPDGDEQNEVVDWLFDYESHEKHWGRALRLADFMAEFDAVERLELVEKTTEKRLESVDRLDRRDNRTSILKGLVREFPDSEGGRTAGLRARAESEDASPQHIRITKSFLLENPAVAGPRGLGLNSRLLNDDDADGELHPDGVLLRGGRVLEFSLIAEGGGHKDPPELRPRKISRQRLSQIASTLDEAVQLNGLIDVDARQSADASRDVYLERASLGLTETVDHRPTAESTHVYQSLRERYGLVRGRDSVLPFDLVVRGSLGEMALGAFPRWRPPRETPDAFLYR